MFRPKGMNRKLGRWKEAVCVRQTKVHAKALRQGTAGTLEELHPYSACWSITNPGRGMGRDEARKGR